METQSQPLESLEQQPFDGQNVVPEIIEQQPLEESQPLETMNQPQGPLELQPLETLESSQPIEDLPVESFSHETQPSPSEIQPLDQQPLETLESSQPIEDLPVESFNHETQPSPSEIQPLDQQPAFSEQRALDSTTYAQEQLRKGVNEHEQPSLKDESVPFVLPFDSQDVTPNS